MPKSSRFAGKIGYTEDGFVWMMMEAQMETGDPIKLTVTLELQDAMDISQHLKEAVQKAANTRSALILPEGVTIQ